MERKESRLPAPGWKSLRAGNQRCAQSSLIVVGHVIAVRSISRFQDKSVKTHLSESPEVPEPEVFKSEVTEFERTRCYIVSEALQCLSDIICDLLLTCRS